MQASKDEEGKTKRTLNRVKKDKYKIPKLTINITLLTREIATVDELTITFFKDNKARSILYSIEFPRGKNIRVVCLGEPTQDFRKEFILNPTTNYNDKANLLIIIIALDKIDGRVKKTG